MDFLFLFLLSFSDSFIPVFFPNFVEYRMRLDTALCARFARIR